MTAREFDHHFKEIIRNIDEYFHGATSDHWLLREKKQQHTHTQTKKNHHNKQNCLSFRSQRHYRWQVIANKELTLAVSLLASGSSMINRCKAWSCNLILEISKNMNNYIFQIPVTDFVLKNGLVSSSRNTAMTGQFRLACLAIDWQQLFSKI